MSFPLLVRWSATLAWTAFTVALMSRPSNVGIVHDLSLFFGGTELTDAAGHVVLFGTLAALWYWTLTGRLKRQRALLLATGIGVAVGIATEFAQYFVPERGVALIDILADCLGPLIVAGILYALTTS